MDLQRNIGLNCRGAAVFLSSLALGQEMSGLIQTFLERSHLSSRTSRASSYFKKISRISSYSNYFK